MCVWLMNLRRNIALQITIAGLVGGKIRSQIERPILYHFLFFFLLSIVVLSNQLSLTQGSKWVSTKSLKARNAEPGGVWTCLLIEPQMKQGGSGVLTQKFFGFWGRKWCIPVPFWVTIFQCPYPLPQKKRNSLQIYTDLKNGPGSWKKV